MPGTDAAAAALDAALHVIMRRPCQCPERHAGTGRCEGESEVKTAGGGMCVPCAQAAAGREWTFDEVPVEWPDPRGAQAGRGRGTSGPARTRPEPAA